MAKEPEPQSSAPEEGEVSRASAAGAPQPAPDASSRQDRQEYADQRGCDQFVSLVSHELRGPLATLTGYAQFLARTETAPEAVRKKAVSAVLEQANRLNVMIESLLQASRIVSGRLRVELQPVALADLVRRIVAEQQASAQHHHLILQLPDVSISGVWDPHLLGLALTSLVSNAIKFSPEGGEVQIVVRREDADAVVSVTDRGIGIAPEDLPTIFQPYHRPARTERFPGLGVGLFVAKGIVEAHGGQIGVHSKRDEGTTFWFRLPLAEEGQAPH